ncbi:protein canopy-1-like isoform X2 [Lolium rigidum]|uniref:protein canopy-1-like isoform X2 n=1 Tax=Lolium rigidum TaxID=89674 RepID=UPI001F5DCF8A|nr:protein canopy-1-like isoform X2 [Lolium rigidum]
MEPRGASRRRSGTLLILLAVFLAAAPATSASAIGDKCAACKAVAAELEIGMSSEKPRNHLDLRNRLNSRGQREGKVIDYRVSELRIVELLDDLCDKMQDYTLQKLDSGEKEWVKVTNWNSYQTDKKAAARAHSKNLSSYCGRLLEETEDELAEWIKTSSAEAGNVSKALCGDISKHCQSTRATTPIDDEL